jgi:integrase
VVPAGWDNGRLRQVPASQSGMHWRFKAAARRAGIPWAHPHQLRHTAITAMIAGTAEKPGISVVDAAHMAGHSNPAITGRVYAHAVAANMERGAAFADDLLAPVATATVEPLKNTAAVSSGM